MEADSAELGKSACLKNERSRKRETEHGCSFPVADGGGYVITMPCVRDDEMPLKREDLRKRAEKKAAKLAAEGMELRPRNGFRAYPGEKVLGEGNG